MVIFNGYGAIAFTGCPKKTMPLLIGIYFYVSTSTGMHLTYTIQEIITLKNQQMEHPQHQRCFHGCHGNKYADFRILKEKYSKFENLPAIRYFDKFIFIF